MNVIVAVALIIVLAGGLYHRVTIRSKILSSQTSVPSSTPTQTPNPTSPPPTLRPPSPIPTYTPSPQLPPPNTSDWQYPGSVQASPGNYQSSDPPEKITDWYQDKIKNLGLNIKTFVRTKANDRVLNKLVGANSQTEIRVEISKNPGDSTTRIIIGIDN